MSAINSSGDLVGSMIMSPDGYVKHGFLYRSGTLIDLNDLITIPGEYISAAYDITDHGVILAGATSEPNRIYLPPRSILLIPVQAAPSPPSGLVAVVSGRVVTLRCQAVVGALDYIVEAGSAPSLSDLYRASIGSQPALMTPAPPGRYYVRVRARNALGESAPSNEVIVDVP